MASDLDQESSDVCPHFLETCKPMGQAPGKKY